MLLRKQLRDPQLRIAIGGLLLVTGILYLRLGDAFVDSGIPRLLSPVSLSDGFWRGAMTGFGGALLGLSVVLNITGLARVSRTAR